MRTKIHARLFATQPQAILVARCISANSNVARICAFAAGLPAGFHRGIGATCSVATMRVYSFLKVVQVSGRE